MLTIISFLVQALTLAVSVTTAQYDVARTGANTSETTLTQSSQIGRRWSYSVNGFIWAQPLVIENVTINATPKMVLVVATGENQLYAFDATKSATFWHDDLGPPFANSDPDFDGGNIGIISTPVVDPSSKVLYFTSCNSSGTWSLHAVNLADGSDFHAPVSISATASGKTFVNTAHLQRPALLLLNGSVYLAFGSYADVGTWYGWLMKYSATTLAQQAVIVTTPVNPSDGAIWMSGGGPASDGTNIFFITGNGPCDAGDYGDSFVEVDQTLGVVDYMTPTNCADLNASDKDLGSGRAIVSGNYVIGAGKDGRLWVLNKSALGSNQATGPGIAQVFTAVNTNTMIASGEAVANGYIYLGSGASYTSAQPIYAYSCPTTCNTTPVHQSPANWVYPAFSYSSNGATAGTAILWSWAAASSANFMTTLGVLSAYNADTMAVLFQDSTLGNLAKFNPPTVANGLVYVPTFSNVVWVLGPVSGGSTYSGITYSGPVVIQ